MRAPETVFPLPASSLPGAQSAALWGALCLASSILSVPAGEKLQPLLPTVYMGMCDASAGVAVSSNRFIAASDEDNVLRLYNSREGGGPIREYDFNAFLGVEGKNLEADLEGAAKVGDTAYWIGSHGRNRVGKERLNRCRLFATRIVGNEDLNLEPVGRPYKRLLEDLADDPRFARFHLVEAATEAPKEEGALNIEGLAATPEGHLLIGFRNPVPQDKALIIPLLNPPEVLTGGSARFGSPIQLDLHGLGIRDMAAYPGGYILIGGPWHAGGHFRFYEWPGPGFDPVEIPVKHLKGYSPEGIIVYPDSAVEGVQILSDDGTRILDGMPCKRLGSAARFRSFRLQLPGL